MTPTGCRRVGMIHPLWKDGNALARLARKIADRCEQTSFLMACTTGHPGRPWCPGPPGRKPGTPPCGPKDYPRDLIDGTTCRKCGTRVRYPDPPTLHF